MAGIAEQLEASTTRQAEALAEAQAYQSEALANVTAKLDRLVGAPHSDVCGTFDDPVQCAALSSLLRATTWKVDVRTPLYSSYCQWKRSEAHV